MKAFCTPESHWLGSLSLAALICLGIGCRTPAPSPAETDLTGRVRNFISRTYIHGVPYEDALRLGPAAAPILSAWLADSSLEQQWPNIAVTLAIVGGPEAGYELSAFARCDHRGRLSSAHCAAKHAALMALGYLVHHTGDQACLQYLIRASDPAYWEALNLQWESPFLDTPQARNLELATQATLGLALCGTPEAIRALESLQQPESPPQVRALQQARPGLVNEALKAARSIAENGLTEYYRAGGHSSNAAPAHDP